MTAVGGCVGDDGVKTQWTNCELALHTSVAERPPH
jgi:hypothetical protein